MYFEDKAKKLFGTADINFKEAIKLADTHEKRGFIGAALHEAMKMKGTYSPQYFKEVWNSIKQDFPPLKQEDTPSCQK